MSFGVSSGVYLREIDRSNLVPTIATTSAGIVGWSTKGDADRIRLITSGKQFIEEYGEPVIGNYFHYSALAFLENGNQLYCKRVNNGGLYGGINIKTSTSGQSNAALGTGVASAVFTAVSGQDNLFTIFGKDPGTWNNTVGITITNVSLSAYTFNINVYAQDENGSDVLMETWTVSRQQQLDGYGRQQYLETMINDFSDYIVVKDNVAIDSTTSPKAQSTVLLMTGGTDGSTPSDAQYITSWDMFLNPDDVDVRILIGAGITSVAVQTEINAIAVARKDCIALFDVPYAQLASVDAIVNWRNNTQNINSSYSALYAPWAKVYDKYNGSMVELPPSGYVASQIAYTDENWETWLPPAGTNRGIMNIVGLTDIFTEGERDSLYAAGINPLQTFKARGNVIWGQKTQQVKASALDRINVRRLMIIIEKSISVSMLDFVFELNSETTRLKVTSMIESYLDVLASRGAFQTETDKGYQVVCDESNNTPAVIDRNEMIVDIYVKPARSAEYIRINTVITNSSAVFSELVSKGVSF